jgi:hypothetical protein
MQANSRIVEIRRVVAAASRKTLFAAAVILFFHCGSAGTPHPDEASTSTVSDGAVPSRICDGSGSIRLAYRSSAPGRVVDYTAVLSELGYDFLYVDGGCHYWIQDPGTPNSQDDYRMWRSYCQCARFCSVS